MKPESNVGGVSFNFHAIPLWLQPDLWDETKQVRFRGLLFISLYALSMAVFGAIIFVPIGIYMGLDAAGTTTAIWLSASLFGGTLSGLGAWWDFVRGCRKIAVEAASSSKDESPSAK